MVHPVHDDLIPRIQREVLPINPCVVHSTTRLVAIRTAFIQKEKIVGEFRKNKIEGEEICCVFF